MTREEAVRLLQGGPEGLLEWNRLRGACVESIDLSGIELPGCVLCGPNSEGVQLARCDLTSANLAQANLTNASLHSCRLTSASLTEAILDNADATGADFSAADLWGASLRGARLVSAKFVGGYVSGMRLDGAEFGATTFVMPRMLDGPSDIIGLDEVKHRGPSWISVNTLLNFRDDLPEVFLRGCGLGDEEIAYFRSRVGAPIRFYSCFISYSAADEEFATRLHNDFQAAGIRCWKWDQDARTGRNLWGEIDQAIRVYDKLVLIASATSLQSPGVNREIERAIVREDDLLRKKQAGQYDGDVDVLFPVRVDDFIFEGWEHERKTDMTRKVVADASGWENDDDKYRNVRDRLLRDLRPD